MQEKGLKRSVTKDELRLVILECGEYLRDELAFGDELSERQRNYFNRLCTRCFEALGNPSLYDVEQLKRKQSRKAVV